jgi:uncharacterized protein
MRIDRDAAAAGPIVTGFTAGGFRVDGAIHPAVLLTVGQATRWSPPPLVLLGLPDLASLTESGPEFILLGTGATLDRPLPALTRAIEAMGIGLEAMDSRAAARAWGVLRGEGRRIAAALYPIG